jgi:hypothetical protein
VTGDIQSTNLIAAPSCCTSDKRVKIEADEPMNPEDSLRRLVDLPLRQFSYTPEFIAAYPGTPTTLQRGLWAQDVAGLVPQAVTVLPEKRVGDQVPKVIFFL